MILSQLFGFSLNIQKVALRSAKGRGFKPNFLVKLKMVLDYQR